MIWRAFRNKEIGFVFQTFNLLARATALHNCELPLIYAGVSADERIERAKGALISVGMETRMNHSPTSFPAVNASASPSPAPLVTVRRSSSPRAYRNLDSQTGLEIMACSIALHSEGNTIVLVTHEHDIAEYAHRIVFIKDGVIARDERKIGASQLGGDCLLDLPDRRSSRL